MENRQYTQEEVMQILQNPEKAAEFQRNFNSQPTVSEQEAPKEPIVEKESVTEPTVKVGDPNTPHQTSWEKDRKSLLLEGFCAPTDCGDDEWLSDEEFNEGLKCDSMQPLRQELVEAQHNLCRNLRGGHELINPQGKTIRPELNKDERELLEYCATHDIMAIIREEFKNNPIDYEAAQNGAWRSFQ